jgi:hypothetical protein
MVDDTDIIEETGLFENQTYKLICGFDSKARYI